MIIEHSSDYFNKKLPYPYEHDGFGRWGITDYDLVMMTPEEYFSKVVEIGTHTKEDVVPSDKEQIERMKTWAMGLPKAEVGERWDIPFIQIDTSGEEMNNQDGRHRVAAMQSMGIEQIPVFLFRKTKQKLIFDGLKVKIKDEKTLYYGSKLSENISLDGNDFLVCRNVPVARTGVQEYYGHELGFDGDEANEVYYLDRPEVEVFDKISMATWETATFTIGHPDEHVSPENYNTLSVGEIRRPRKSAQPDENGNQVLIVDIVVKNKDAIKLIQDGRREVSAGYKANLEWVDESARKLKQTKIRVNHAALVEFGRAGTAKIKDEKTNELILDEDLKDFITNEEIFEHKEPSGGGNIMAKKHKHSFDHKNSEGKVINTYVVEGIKDKSEAKKVAIEAAKQYKNQKNEKED